MTTSAHRSISMFILSYNLKSVYKTSVKVFSEIHLSKALSSCPLFFLGARTFTKMPIVSAVAAYRHRHSSCVFHANLVHLKFQQLTCGSPAIPINPVVGKPTPNRTYSHGLITSNARPAPQRSQSLPLDNMDNVARRNYAKGRDKPKPKTKVTINEAEMREVLDVDAMKGQMDKLIDDMKDEFSKQLSIRGSSGALETLSVVFEGETHPLQELAQVGRKNPQLVVLNMASLPDAIQPVLKAIQESGMNLNPQQEGTTIYVPLPKVTREHRENLAKNAKVLFNKYKTSFQSIQNKYVKQCKSQKEISEDLSFSVQQMVMKITEVYIMEAEKLMQAKQTELLDNK